MIVIDDDSSEDDERKDVESLLRKSKSPVRRRARRWRRKRTSAASEKIRAVGDTQTDPFEIPQTKRPDGTPRKRAVVTLPTVINDNDEDASTSEEAWMNRFKSPLKRVVGDAMASSSSSDDIEALPKPRLSVDARKRESKEDENDGNKTEVKVGASEVTEETREKMEAATTGASSSTRVDLVASAHLGGKSKVLFEIEGNGEAVDLDGDTGAVGRWLAESARSLKVDMKGLMYNARVVPLAGTVVVVAVNGDVAKIDSVHREFVQLREDPVANAGTENYGVGSLFEMTDEAHADGDRAEKTVTGKKRARAADGPKRATAKRKPASARSKSTKSKPRARAKK